jgi:ABC-type sugar transport system ATPase subunit
MANAPAALSSAPEKSNGGPILKMTGVSKRFPGVRALENVHLEVGPSEIHALLGENGAGKSTLLKILSGAHSADAGEIELFGELVAFATPHDAQRAGIVTIYQEFTLAPDMTIAENVFIGREPGSKLFVSWRRLAEETKAIANRIGLKRSPMTTVRDLSVAEQQLVEIARALSMQSRLIVMDEPTAALSEAEVANLVRIVRALKAEGLSIIFVTHRLDEVFRLCDRYTVLRDGHYVASGQVAETNVEAIIRMMVGRDVGALRRAPNPRAWEGCARGRGPDPSAQRARSERHRAGRRFAESPSGRDSGPCGPRRRRPHRDRARDFRSRSFRPWNDPCRWERSSLLKPARRDVPRHRPRT